MSVSTYASRRFKFKKELRAAVAAYNAGKERAVRVEDFGLFSPANPTEGSVCIAGPSRYEPNAWYANVTLKSGAIVKVS